MKSINKFLVKLFTFLILIVLININPCFSYNKSNLNKTVVIDAGHGGYDPGSIGCSGGKEKNITLSVALKVGSILKKNGVNVVYTRKSDTVTWSTEIKKALISRANIANNIGADFFISIHTNHSDISSIRGTESYYMLGSSKGKKMAQMIQNSIIKKTKFKDRDIRYADYSVLRNVRAPAVLVELGYTSNYKEATLLHSKRYQDLFAEAIANGILKYIDS